MPTRKGKENKRGLTKKQDEEFHAEMARRWVEADNRRIAEEKRAKAFASLNAASAAAPRQTRVNAKANQMRKNIAGAPKFYPPPAGVWVGGRSTRKRKNKL